MQLKVIGGKVTKKGSGMTDTRMQKMIAKVQKVFARMKIIGKKCLQGDDDSLGNEEEEESCDSPPIQLPEEHQKTEIKTEPGTTAAGPSSNAKPVIKNPVNFQNPVNFCEHLGLSDNDLMVICTKDLSKLLKEQGISEERAKELKAERRTLKNRGYAAYCQMRREDEERTARQEMKDLEEAKKALNDA